MTTADLDPVIGLAASIPEAPRWSRSAWEALLAETAPPRRVLLADSHGTIVGFVAGQIIAEVCELESIAVAPAHRRSGVSTALRDAFVAWARQHGLSKVQLEVRSANTSAIAFYSKSGFECDGLRHRYYQNPEDDALLMTLPLAPSLQP